MKFFYTLTFFETVLDQPTSQVLLDILVYDKLLTDATCLAGTVNSGKTGVEYSLNEILTIISDHLDSLIF